MKQYIEGAFLGIVFFILFMIVQIIVLPTFNVADLIVYYAACTLLLCAVYYAYRR